VTNVPAVYIERNWLATTLACYTTIVRISATRYFREFVEVREINGTRQFSIFSRPY